MTKTIVKLGRRGSQREKGKQLLGVHLVQGTELDLSELCSITILGRQPRGATPRPRSGGCAGARGPRGATPRSRSGGAVVRRYPSSKVRNPSKMIGVARGIRGQIHWNHNHRKLVNLISRTTALSNSMKLSHAVWGHPRVGHDGEVWQNVVHWRREWQTTSVFLPWEPHEQYEKAKW